MNFKNHAKSSKSIEIRITNQSHLESYQKGLLTLLGQIDINDLDEALKNEVKSVYRLLMEIENNMETSK
ncbi:MAG: hypothetical protein AAFX87_29995 [Bacteroidota bacterium]